MIFHLSHDEDHKENYLIVCIVSILGCLYRDFWRKCDKECLQCHSIYTILQNLIFFPAHLSIDL